MQAFFAHRGDLCRICKDLPPPRAAVFVQKHNGTRIREAQLFGGETLLCFAKARIPFILLIAAPGIRAFSAGCSVGSLSSVCRSASGLHFVKSSGQGRNQAQAAVLCEGTKFPENNKKMRFCVFTKPHLWCAGTFGIRTFPYRFVPRPALLPLFTPINMCCRPACIKKTFCI